MLPTVEPGLNGPRSESKVPGNTGCTWERTRALLTRDFKSTVEETISLGIALVLLRVTWQEDAHTCPDIGNVKWRSHSMQGEYSSV